MVLTSTKPKVHPWYQSPRSTLGTHSCKTQGPSWYILLPNQRHCLSPLTYNNYNDHRQGSKFRKVTCHPIIGKTFNQVKATLTPHNHRGSTSKGQEGPPLDCMIGPSIRCSSHSLLITIKGGIQQVKRPIPTLVRKDLQPGVIQTQILIIRKEEALQNKRKPYHMGDKTCNQVEIKPEMTPCQSTIYKTTTVLLLHHDGLFIRPQVRSIAKIKATYIHTCIQDKQFKIHH